MTTTSRRRNRRHYTKDRHEHLVFVGVILLAATVYVHRVKSPLSQQRILEIAAAAIAGCGAVLFIILLRKLTMFSRERRFAHMEIDAMSGTEFEQYIAGLLPAQGYRHIRLTSYFDYGCDITAEKEGVSWSIQVKRYSGPVGVEAVRQAVTAQKHYGCTRSMVITNSSYTKRAHSLARSNNCALVGRQQLLAWVSV